MPTKRRRRAPTHYRFTPEIIGAILQGITGLDLDQMLRLGRNETLMSAVPPLLEQARALHQRGELEQFLGFKLRPWHLERLGGSGWAAGKRPPAGESRTG
jgi:hypothetical protein